jgi:hypothetical protein
MSDLLLNQNHDLQITRFDLSLVQGRQLIAQRIKQSLLFFLNEWFLATNEGRPYFRDVLIKNPNRATVEGVFKAAILNVEGVIRLTSFDLQFDNNNRRLTLNFSCSTTDGVVAIENFEVSA